MVNIANISPEVIIMRVAITITNKTITRSLSPMCEHIVRAMHSSVKGYSTLADTVSYTCITLYYTYFGTNYFNM